MIFLDEKISHIYLTFALHLNKNRMWNTSKKQYQVEIKQCIII